MIEGLNHGPELGNYCGTDIHEPLPKRIISSTMTTASVLHESFTSTFIPIHHDFAMILSILLSTITSGSNALERDNRSGSIREPHPVVSIGFEMLIF